MKSVKESVLEVMQDLPDECTWDDVMYRLYVRRKIDVQDRAEEEVQDDGRPRGLGDELGAVEGEVDPAREHGVHEGARVADHAPVRAVLLDDVVGVVPDEPHLGLGLRRLEDEGLVSSSWEAAEIGRRAAAGMAAMFEGVDADAGAGHVNVHGAEASEDREDGGRTRFELEVVGGSWCRQQQKKKEKKRG